MLFDQFGPIHSRKKGEENEMVDSPSNTAPLAGRESQAVSVCSVEATPIGDRGGVPAIGRQQVH